MRSARYTVAVNGPLYLLGPQRPNANMPTALATVNRPGRVLYITAGWRHDENDDEALRRDLGTGGFPLPLYAWFEELAKTAPDLFAAHHSQQDEIRKLKTLYRARLDAALQAVRVMLAHAEQRPDVPYVKEEFDDAIASVRALRQRYIRQCDSIRERFAEKWDVSRNRQVARRMIEIEGLVREARAVLIAGGHVGVLRNRLEFFGLGPILQRARHRGVGIIAWSAGAMALTDEVVLFHDDPPVGQSNAEVLDRGLGLATGIVALPHARERLWLHDRTRVAVLGWRFAVPVVGLENGAWLEQRDGAWVNRGQADAAYQLCPDGATRLVDTFHA